MSWKIYWTFTSPIMPVQSVLSKVHLHVGLVALQDTIQREKTTTHLSRIYQLVLFCSHPSTQPRLDPSVRLRCFKLPPRLMQEGHSVILGPPYNALLRVCWSPVGCLRAWLDSPARIGISSSALLLLRGGFGFTSMEACDPRTD